MKIDEMIEALLKIKSRHPNAELLIRDYSKTKLTKRHDFNSDIGFLMLLKGITEEYEMIPDRDRNGEIIDKHNTPCYLVW